MYTIEAAKLIPVFQVTTHDGSKILCRDMEQVKGVLDQYIDEGYLQPVDRDDDYSWVFEVNVVMVSELLMNTVEPFEL